MAEEPMIRMRSVDRTYRKGSAELRVLQDLDFNVDKGEFVALMGPSGSGKSTILNLAGGLDRPDGGEIHFEGEHLDDLSEGALAAWRARNIGFIFQAYNLIPVLTAQQNVELPLLLTPLGRGKRKEQARLALEVAGIGHRASHFPKQLSGGEEQRVSVARAIATDPKVLLADEPTGDLDAENAASILDLLCRLNEENGQTIVMVTHDPKAAERAHRVMHLQKGVLVSKATA
ncbi:MAG: ABC transporter ATP-binding protein [Planctomycetota bacterium]|nr:ABC transporter ATP-binding protein [Planctomycetota bacterium]